MKRHLAYLKYVLNHKRHVYHACRITRAPWWRSVIHDWSKFLPCEWFPYVEKFYGNKVDASEPDDFRYWTARGPVDANFNHAWNHHQKSNKHHWQYWLLTNDSDTPQTRPLAMPDRYVREMVADWVGAGIAITGRMEVGAWYASNKSKIILFEQTRDQVEQLIAEVENYYRVGRNLGLVFN